MSYPVADPQTIAMCSVCLCALCSVGGRVDSRAWLIAVPDTVPPAAALTELAVH